MSPDPSGSADRARAVRRAPALLVLCLLVTLLRLALILMPPEELSPGGQLPPEELRRGMAADEIVRGPLLPFLDHQMTHFSGGTLAIALVAAPVYALFGPSAIALRLATLPFAWATVALAFVLLDRARGRRAAWIGGLLAVAASPGYALVGSTAWGTHVESNVFALLVVLASWQHAARRTARSAASHGLACGLALSFSYGTALAIAVVVAVEIARDRGAVLRHLTARAAGFALGLAPWLAYNLTHDFAGLGVYGRSAAEHFSAPGAAASHALAFAARHLPASFDHPGLPGVPGGRIDALVAGALALLWLVALVRARGPLAIAVVAYPPAFALAYVAGGFQAQEEQGVFGHRYLMLLHPFLWLAAALALDALAARGGIARVAACAAAGLLVLIPAAGTLRRIEPDRWQANLDAPGRSTASLARFVVRRRGTDTAALARVIERVERRPAQETEEFYRRLAANYRFLLDPAARLEPKDQARLPEYRRAFEFLGEHVAAPHRAQFAPAPGGADPARGDQR